MHENLERLLSLLPQAEARYCAAGSRLAALRRSGDAAARIEWTTAPRYSPSPFGIERLQQTPGEVLPSPPQVLAGVCRYGFAASGEVIYADEYTSIEGRKYEEFWEHLPDRIETTLYDYHEPEKQVINVQTLFLAHGRPAGFVRWAMHGIVVEHYEYADGVLAHVHRAEREHDPSSPRHALLLSRDEIVYRDGALAEIVRHWADGNTERLHPAQESHDDERTTPDSAEDTAAPRQARAIAVADALLGPGRDAQAAEQQAHGKRTRARSGQRRAAIAGLAGFALGAVVGHVSFDAGVPGAVLGLGLGVAGAYLIARRTR